MTNVAHSSSFEIAAYNHAYVGAGIPDQDPRNKMSKEDMVSSYLELVRSKPTGQRKIILRAVFGKQQGSFSLCPTRNGITGDLLGVTTYSPEEARLAKRAVTEETTRKIMDGFPLDLENPIDSVDAEWILRSEEVCTSQWDAQRTKGALFYVEDLEREVNQKLKSRELKAQAGTLVFAMSATERIDLCRLLGNDVREWKAADILDFLSEKAEINPRQIIDLLSDQNRDTKIFMFRLMDERVITQFQGVYFYGQTPLGTNETAVMSWMSDRNNKQMVNNMYLQLKPTTTAQNGQDDQEYMQIVAERLKREQAEKSAATREQEQYRPDPNAGSGIPANNAAPYGQPIPNTPPQKIEEGIPSSDLEVAYMQGGDDADIPGLEVLEAGVPLAYQPIPAPATEAPLFSAGQGEVPPTRNTPPSRRRSNQ